jgi:N-glycosylase/DNA lyase
MEENSFSSWGQIFIVGVAAVAIAFAIWQYLGKQWIENTFAKHMAKMEREHSNVVQALTANIQSLKTARKLQELDFAVLPRTWELFEKAYNAVRSILRFGEYKIDVEHLDGAELKEVMATMEWFQAEINRVRALDGFARQDEFDNIRFTYQIRRVKEVCDEFDEFVNVNAVSYSQDMMAELQEMGRLLQLAVVEKERIGLRPAADEKLSSVHLDENFAARANAMSVLIRKKLESHEQTPM